MDEVVDCSENGKSDCNWRNAIGGQECCNGEFCCSPEIFNQLKALPCVDQNGCRTLGYGNFWFPAKENISESSTCCDDYPSWIRLLYHLRTSFKSEFVVQTLFFCCVSIFDSYLIFVIFFTRAKFLENKIYTEKRQFFRLKCVKKNALFRVKSVENANFLR